MPLYVLTCDDCHAWTTARGEDEPDVNATVITGEIPAPGKWENERDDEERGQCQHDDYVIGEAQDNEPDFDPFAT